MAEESSVSLRDLGKKHPFDAWEDWIIRIAAEAGWLLADVDEVRVGVDRIHANKVWH